MVSDINDSRGHETVRRITLSGGKAAFRRCNVSRLEEAEAMVALAEETFGGLDFLINNASGPGHKPGTPLDEMAADHRGRPLSVLSQTTTWLAAP